ncbi:MAG: alpha-galactosidase [Lachnospiraceae bacterium]|nr:alpha-galactosidase [Lachnospiraceae bacterium]
MEIKKYYLGDTCFEYLIDETNNVGLRLYPKSKEAKALKQWELQMAIFNPRARHSAIWSLGRLAYFHLVGENLPFPGSTMKTFYMDLPLISQNLKKEGNKQKIETLLGSASGCHVLHTITYIEGLGGFEVETEFINDSGKDVTLDMLTSFTIDTLSPFHEDDAPDSYNFYRFNGNWSQEGRHTCHSIEELSLEKAWPGAQGCYGALRYGSKGSYPVLRYFPMAAFEDKTEGVFWAASIAHNATWQLELTRWDDSLSFSGGLGDREFCGWKKHVKNGERFKAPKAYIATAAGDIHDVCSALTDMYKPARESHGEKGLPTTFNEYCATWGKPTQEKMLSYCNALKKYGVKYLVIDAGWCKAGCEQNGNGEWNLDTTIFPNVKEMNRIIRENGMIPGIWFEFEVTTKGSVLFNPEYDYMHLTKDGTVVKTGDVRSYWDFRRQDVRDYLYEKVIKFLKDNDFGYIKVDYNGSIGVEIDGAESGAEALRDHMSYVKDFFALMKKEIPDLIIENCAGGGHRNEPLMMGHGAVSSFSDAHECVEIPYVAANLQDIMLPAQMLIWSVLHEDDSKDRLVYSLAATFMGRVCLSGPIDQLQDWQQDILSSALRFYEKLEDIIINGKSKVYGNRSECMRYPKGLQVVCRSTNTEMLILYHAFEKDIKDLEIDIPDGFQMKDTFFGDKIHVTDGKVKILGAQPFTAGAVLLSR